MYYIERKVGACEFVVDKLQEALFPLIQQYILPGSIIHSDSAAMYVNLHTDPPSSHIASIPSPYHMHHTRIYGSTIAKILLTH